MTSKEQTIKKTASTAAEPTMKKAEEEEKTYCYIGPNLPDGKLKKNAILLGTKASIREKFKEEIEKYPQMAYLIIETKGLAKAKENVQAGNTMESNFYSELEASIEAEYERRRG